MAAGGRLGIISWAGLYRLGLLFLHSPLGSIREHVGAEESGASVPACSELNVSFPLTGLIMAKSKNHTTHNQCKFRSGSDPKVLRV